MSITTKPSLKSRHILRKAIFRIESRVARVEGLFVNHIKNIRYHHETEEVMADITYIDPSSGRMEQFHDCCYPFHFFG